MLEGRMGEKRECQNQFYPVHHFLREVPVSSTQAEMFQIWQLSLQQER